MDAAYRHLRGRGVAVEEPVVRDYGMKQLTVADPDGFIICFQSPHPDRPPELLSSVQRPDCDSLATRSAQL